MERAAGVIAGWFVGGADAATAISTGNQLFALQIGLVHMLYNVFGVTLFLVTPWLKELPLRSAQWLGNKVETHRAWAFGYPDASQGHSLKALSPIQRAYSPWMSMGPTS